MPKHGIKFETLETYPIKREPKHLYCIDKDGFVWKCPLGKQKKVEEVKTVEVKV